MTTAKGPAPGFVNHPQHLVQISQSDHRWIVRVGGTVVASSRRALVLKESGYEPVVYFPSDDVVADWLTPIDRLTTCPFKGEAHYFADRDAETDEPVAWTYPSVYDEVSDIAGHIAFYSERAEVVTEPSRRE